jgi:hypothetical protein
MTRLGGGWGPAALWVIGASDGSTHGDRHPTELAALRGAHVVTAVETERGHQAVQQTWRRRR